MPIISSKEFATNQEKYFDMALDEQVIVKRGDYMFQIICSNFDAVNIEEQAVLEPDDDLRSAITKEEFKAKAREMIHHFFVDK